VAGEARLGGSGGRIFPVPLTRRARVASPRFSVCPASLERPLCSEDGLGAPDTVSGRVGQKEALGDVAENVFLSGAPQIPLSCAIHLKTRQLLALPCSTEKEHNKDLRHGNI
jgi:hypothetical protein